MPESPESPDPILSVVVGTAGHIDHGKSRLVRKLTGIDPDRLPEEKTRGLTIDLGFASLRLPDGRRVGIIDVPGHERLVKNMVAGATGIDLVLLVVAADDGVMPQTREHLTIMEVLGLRHGVVAITKVDLVDSDLRELVRDEVEESLSGTLLEGSPIIPVSSETGEGIDELREELFARLRRIAPRPSDGVFRMPIQRVFSPKGFGTVVTGVPLSGHVTVGDSLEVTPLGESGRVRALQAYGEPTNEARAGHSTAINLSDVDYRSIQRGMVAGAPGFFLGSEMLEARLCYLPTTRRPLVHRTPVRFHVGTAEVLGRVHLLEGRRVEPGERTLVQLRLEQPVVSVAGDSFVLRLQTPMETIGGGEVIGTSSHRLKSGKDHVIEGLRRRERSLGDARLRLLEEIMAAGFDTVAEKEIPARLALTPAEARQLVEELLAEGRLQRAERAGQLLAAERLDEAVVRARAAASAWYEENPRRIRMERGHLRQAIGASDLFAQSLIARLEEEGWVDATPGGGLGWSEHGPRLDEDEQALRETILRRLLDAPFTPPSPEEVAEEARAAPGTTRELFDLLEEEALVRKAGESVYFHHTALEEARRRLADHLREAGSMTAADARKLLETTRKYIIPLLELLDRDGFTRRRGDVRELRDDVDG